MSKKDLLKVGDAIIGFNEAKGKRNIFVSERKTILEILSKPEDEVGQRKLVGEILDRYNKMGRKNVTVYDGQNLCDDPRMSERLDSSKVYVLEI